MIVSFIGNITDKTPHWFFQASQSENGGGNKLQGYLPDHGGKLFSTPVSLQKTTTESGYYLLRFVGKTNASAYAGVEFFGDDDAVQVQPDNNDGVRGKKARKYEILFHAEPQSTRVRIFFMSQDGVEVRNVELKKITASAAAKFNKRIYAGMAPINYQPPQSVSDLLPHTAQAILSGTHWRMVMLGDSIVNDTYNSCFTALIKQDFPQAKLEIVCSVRGSTGCWFYQEEENFQQYVAEKKPDLLIIGGISNPGQEPAAGLKAIENVVHMAQNRIGCEILLLSQGFAHDTRLFDMEKIKAPIPPQIWQPANDIQKFMLLERELAAKINIPFLDATSPAYEYVYASEKPFHFFNRDKVHSNLLGKQINGRILQRFLTPRS